MIRRYRIHWSDRDGYQYSVITDQKGPMPYVQAEALATALTHSATVQRETVHVETFGEHAPIATRRGATPKGGLRSHA